MKDNRIVITKNWRRIIFLSVIFILGFIAQDIFREILIFNNELEDLTVSLDNQIREETQFEVDYRNIELQSMLSAMSSNIETHIVEVLDDAVFATSIVIGQMDNPDESEIIATLSQIIEDYDHSDHNHNFYILKNDGTLIYDGETKTTVSIDTLGYTDEFNRYYINDLISGLDSSVEEHYAVEAYFYNEETTLNDQFIFVGSYIQGTDYIVYTSGDYNKFKEASLSDYYQYLDVYYDLMGNSIILFRDQTLLYHENPDYIGTLFSELDDSLYFAALQDISSFTANNIRGFLTVRYYNNDSEDIVEQLTYVKYVPEYDFYIAYSKSAEEYDYLIDTYYAENLKTSLLVLLPLYSVLSILAIIVIRLIITNNKLSFKLYQEEENLYSLFADFTDDIIIITDKKGEIQFSNKLGKKTIYGEFEGSVNIDKIMQDEEGYKVLIGVEQNFYVKYSLSEIEYNGERADLYIITDVTEKVTTERKLEALTMEDDLTKLGNRRLLIKDYRDIMLPYIKDGSKGYFGMLDLDNFKEANDQFGHAFGDEVLQNISDIFKEEMNHDIRIYRVGGDEFAIMITNRSDQEAIQTLRKMRNRVATFKYEHPIHIGFSSGLVEINIKDDLRRFSDYYEKADQLLYRAKEEGKGTIKF